MSNSIAAEIIATKILVIRGKKVMLDIDLAVLYVVKTGRLNEQVSRNIKRFPGDFMFQLTKEEALNLKSHFATSSWGGIRKLPRVFTQEGVAMLSSVLNSERAIMVNIQIMRAFAQLRRMLLTNRDLKRKIEEMEKKYDKQFAIVFQAIKQLIDTPAFTGGVLLKAKLRLSCVFLPLHCHVSSYCFLTNPYG
ncbi:MAG: ORF6N domain-containing protein [Candidatus Omnitrophica bacterium]|nr:ORF6N domain-containing protein [Candidatus Omnitrophota bacterium]MDD5593063.1 ORF6N domain-containing protein [Candidatus Omnitrophota bacterium]